MSGSSSHPAPQYGEYATPEEVAAALGNPAPPEPAQQADSIAPSSDAGTASPSPGTASPSVPGTPSAGARAARPAAPWDRASTLALLAFGLVNLLTAIPGLLSLDELMRSSVATVYGGVEVPFGLVTRIAGQLLLVAQAAILVASAIVAWRRLRRGRLAFWVPLAGAGLTMLVTVLAMVVVVAAEPGVADALQNIQPAG